MISCLRIRNLAIIDSLDIDLGPGLNVLTGETGAGKSILVNALELVLGGRGKGELVRAGCKQAEVEALFDIDLESDRAIKAQLEALELETGELVLRRVLLPNGRTRAFINGQLASQRQLAALAKGLADISSQHEHHTLSRPDSHLSYLDAFGGLERALRRVAETYRCLTQITQSLREFENQLREGLAGQSRLKQEVEELEAIDPIIGEDSALEAECQRLRHTEQLAKLMSDAALLLYDGDDSIADQLRRVDQYVAEAATLYPELQGLTDQVAGLLVQLEDTGREMSRHLGRSPAELDSLSSLGSPEALNEAEERLYQLSKIKRRYGGTLSQVLEHLARSRQELDALCHHTEAQEQLTKQQQTALKDATRAAEKLGRERRKAATRLGAAISEQLHSLGMGDAEIRVEVRPFCREQGGHLSAEHLGTNNAELSSAELSSTELSSTERVAPLHPSVAATRTGALSERGTERAEFLIATNVGEPARPLCKVASGGELSRAMLAIKCVLADLGPSGMYVFDEVDSGIGGGMAEVIGRKIRHVSQHRQVLCITHLAQIAVFADQHLKVSKTQQGARTTSTVRSLNAAEQKEEIARMLGGLSITDQMRATAKEMLETTQRLAKTKGRPARNASAA